VIGKQSLADVRFAPESGQMAHDRVCPLCAKSGHMQCSDSQLLDHFVGALLECPRHVELNLPARSALGRAKAGQRAWR